MTNTSFPPSSTSNDDPTTVATHVADRLRSHGAGRWALAGVGTLALIGFGVLGVGLTATDRITDSVSGVREIVVDIGAGPVTLTGTSGTAVGVETISHGLFSANAGHDLVDGVLTIRADGWGLNSYTEEHIAVPAGIPVQVHTGAGDVTAVDLDVPRFSLDTNASTVKASFRTAPQSISVDAGALGGIDIRVPDAGYSVTADAGIGSENVSISHDPSATRSIHIETLVGGIDISPR